MLQAICPLWMTLSRCGVGLKRPFRGLSQETKTQATPIGIYSDGIEASLKNRNHNAKLAYASLPDLLENAVYLDYAENTKPRKRKGVLGYETYISVAQIGGKRYPVKITVDLMRPDSRGQGYYYHQLEKIELGDSLDIPGVISSEEAAPHGSSSSSYRLGHVIGKIKPPASKVIDENGEPLAVYHGTNTPADFLGRVQTKGCRKLQRANTKRTRSFRVEFGWRRHEAGH